MHEYSREMPSSANVENFEKWSIYRGNRGNLQNGRQIHNATIYYVDTTCRFALKIEP